MTDKFLIDTNVFIQLGQRQYVPDLYPDLWEFIFELIDRDVILVSKFVIKEIKDKLNDDEANQGGWRDRLIDNIMTPIVDEQYQKEYGMLANKCNTDSRYRGECGDRKLGRFLDRADVWQIAIAKNEGYTVISNEEPGSLKIPTIYHLEGVNCMTLVEFFRQLQVKFQITIGE